MTLIPAMTLGAALVFSPGRKAQTRRDGVLYLVQESDGEWKEEEEDDELCYTHQLFTWRGDTLRSDGLPLHYQRFLDELHAHGLDEHALIWYPIGYTPISEE